MVKQKTVCIVGAGVAGLAAAKTFAARGHRVTILERSSDLGGVWEPARSYPEVQTQKPQRSLSVYGQADAGLVSGMAKGAAGSCLSDRICEGPRPDAADAVQLHRGRHGASEFRRPGLVAGNSDFRWKRRSRGI